MCSASMFDRLHTRALSMGRCMISTSCTREDDECPICLEPLHRTAVFIASCGHVWHLACHRKLRDTTRCCMCRQTLKGCVPTAVPTAEPSSTTPEEAIAQLLVDMVVETDVPLVSISALLRFDAARRHVERLRERHEEVPEPRPPSLPRARRRLGLRFGL